MTKKVNKAEALAWYAEQREQQRMEEMLSDQRTALFYAANKRDGGNWPDPDDLARLGYTDAASKVRQAYNLLEEAEFSFRKQEHPALYN